jgi:hypothetical protein
MKENEELLKKLKIAQNKKITMKEERKIAREKN